MKRQTQTRYPASSDVVIRMFTDKDYHERKLRQLGIEFEILEHEFDGDALRLRSKRAVPVQAGGIAGKFLPATAEVVNDERWQQSDKSGSVVVETRGVPLEMSCAASLHDDGDGCIIEYAWQIEANVPMGAGTLEKFVVKDMERREAEEHDAAIALLDDYR